MTETHYLGIDPGLTGAMAVLTERGELVEVVDLPTFKAASGRNLIDAQRLALALGKYRRSARVFIEQVAARPSDSRVAAFAFGRALGAIEAAVAIAGIPMARSQPAAWKRTAGIGAGSAKDASIEAARRLVPASEPLLTAKSHHNRADALLIAWHGLRHG